MAMPYLEYELQNGYVHNWLVAGPLESDVEGPSSPGQSEHHRKLEIAEDIHNPDLQVEETPSYNGEFEINDQTLTWQYVRCRDDHFVDRSTFRHTWQYLRTWAYAQLDCFEGQEVTFVLTTNGPADVWINGEHVHRQAHFHHQLPVSVAFKATLEDDVNEVVVRFEAVAARECPYVMALEVREIDPMDVTVRISSNTERTVRHMMLERVFEQACIESVANYRGKVVNLHWVDDLETRFNYHYSIQDDRGRLYVSGQTEAQPGAVNDVGHGFRIWQGAYAVTLRPVSEEYYAYDVRYERNLPLTILDNAYAEEPYGTYEERHQEALEYAVTQQGDLYAEIARFKLRQWDEIDTDVIEAAIARINRREDCSDLDLVGLLGVMARFGDEEGFPENLKAPLRACVLNFKYWHDEPGSDAMCMTTENHSILFHTCEILAGQLYPDEVFTNAGEVGTWHREKGERLARAWLRARGRTGFWEWDSNCYFGEDILALSHLAGLAETQDVMELAAVVLDKIFFTMAVNSYKGAFGSTHGRTYSRLIKSAKLESTSGISRLMFGMGIYNQHLRGLVAMASSEYEFPLMIGDIARHLSDEMWNRERHVVGADGDEVNKVTYKTPDFMLASAQDYHPGARGYQQHVWQATMGPDAAVFVTHPPNVSEEGAHRPNFWHGNVTLPRVAQWKDVLFAVHQLPKDDWMGFTHAHFPIYCFDESVVEDGWAFARKGDGYLALTAAQGLESVMRGPGACRELRSYGQENVWVCQMGRAALDGDFEAFQERVRASSLTFDGLSVQYTSLRGDDFAFGWEGPLTRNGEAVAITGFPHYENPYCSADLPAEQMDIEFGEYVMRLQF
jgi:hypothetical protein